MWTHQSDTRVRLLVWTALALVLWLSATCGPPLTPLPPAQAPAPSDVVAPPTASPAAPPNAAEALRARRLMIPVEGITLERLRNTFGDDRDGGARQHGAIDIMAPRGTAVLAADDGRILRMGFNALGGLTIYQTDPDRRFVYYYAHLDRYASALQDGASVSRGDLIGYVGSSGNASPTAPHLHFQVLLFRDRYWEGEAVNPYGIFELAGKRR